MLACALAAGTSSLPAAADEFDTVNVATSASIIYDSNLFRLSDSATVPANLGTSKKSDLITTASVGLKFDKRYAQQRFQLSLTESVYRYSNFSFLDFEALDYRGAWLWHLTPRVSGVLSADRKKTLVPFQDSTGRNRLFQQALRTVENQRFSVDAMVSGPWHLVGGAAQVEVADSRIVTGEQAFSALTYEAGIKYVSGSSNSIALVGRRLDGEYQESRLDPVNLFDNAFDEDQVEVVGRWAPTGKSSFSGRIAWVDRKHEHIPQRDFEGAVGNLDYTWAPTGKLRFTVGARRTLGTFWDRLFSSYRTRDIISLGTRWQVSARSEAGFRFEYTASEHKGALIAGGPLRKDDTYETGIFATWAPWRNVAFRASLDYVTRSSTIPGFDFDATIGSLTATLTF